AGHNGNGHRVERHRERERDPAEIRAAIERARSQVAHSALALRAEVARAMDWREWVARRPGLFVAAALALGFLIGARRRARGG
ncbi:MAG TPA: hypothetical protein VHF22_09080, partial [Planctomycetota bacterium]|nr:hypothetical protein [Planctomycetota bacterium]